MNVAIIGSRHFKNYELLKETCDKFNLDETDLIVSGGAQGADKLAEKYANEKNIKTLIFIPDWKQFGKKAGFIRNEKIIDNCDMVIAFWDGYSRGTAHSLKLAQKKNKKIHIFSYAI